MSIYDLKEICLKIGVKENITDPRYLVFMKDWNFTSKVANNFDSEFYGSCHSIKAEKIINFICEYKNRYLWPDKCGLWEPLKYESKGEKEAIEAENETAIKNGEDIRKNHYGTTYETISPISTKNK